MPSVISLIVAAFFLVSLPIQVHALTPAQVFDKVKDSIVVVKTLDAQGKVKGQGSGVLLPSGKIATNCHVVEGGATYQVGRGKELVRATLYAEDGDKDICLLDAKGITGKPAQLGKAAALKVGVPVYAVGAPKGLELSLSDGIVAQLRGGQPPLIQITAAISPGSSGGGLFDGEGRLVGLTTLYIEGGQSLNFAMPVEWIGEVKPGRKPVAGIRSQTDWPKRVPVLVKMSDWQGLLEWCREWTKSEPNEEQAWAMIGLAYYQLRRYNDAIDASRQMIRINSESRLAWAMIGLVYNDLGRYNDVIGAYREVIRIDPKNDLAWNAIGSAYNKLGRYNDAIDALRKALHINPKNADTWKDLGITYRELKRYDEAIEAFRQAIRIKQEHADAWCGLGNTYSKLDRYDDAIDVYRQAIRINPEFAAAWNNLGLAYYVSGKRSAALEVVQKLRRLDPEQADKLFDVIVPR